MFDDPSRELERLQKELLAAQEPPEEAEDEIDPDQALEDIRRMLVQEDWEEDRREPLYRSYWDDREAEPEPEAPPAPRRQSIPPVPQKRRSRYGLLLAVLALETAALAIMALWWYLWLK